MIDVLPEPGKDEAGVEVVGSGSIWSLVEVADASSEDVVSLSPVSVGEAVGARLSDGWRALSVGDTEPPYSHPSPNGIDGP